MCDVTKPNVKHVCHYHYCKQILYTLTDNYFSMCCMHGLVIIILILWLCYFGVSQEHMKKLEKTLNIAPSEKSYQVLARGCKNPEDGFALLNEIKV